MTNFLIKLFIKNNQDTENVKVRGKYGILASITGVIANFILCLIKLILGLLSASVSIIADAFNNLSDAGSSIVTMIGFKLSDKKVDKDHPWGHGRMEYVTAFIVDMLIIFVAFELFKTSINKIINPTLPEFSYIIIIILSVAILIKIWLFTFYNKIAKKINSSSLKATAIDSLTDSISTFVTLISAIIALIYQIPLDGYAGVLVAGFIMFTGLRAAKETIDLLLGSKPDPEFITEIYNFVGEYKQVVGIHDIMVHDYGPGRKTISFHAEVPADNDILEAHDIIDQIERELYIKYGYVVTIHLDPIVVDDEEINELKLFTENIVKNIDERFSIHDFRMTDGGKHKNLIFDLVVPHGLNFNKNELADIVKQKIQQSHPNYYAVITVENPYM